MAFLVVRGNGGVFVGGSGTGVVGGDGNRDHVYGLFSADWKFWWHRSREGGGGNGDGGIGEVGAR